MINNSTKQNKKHGKQKSKETFLLLRASLVSLSLICISHVLQIYYGIQLFTFSIATIYLFIILKINPFTIFLYEKSYDEKEKH